MNSESRTGAGPPGLPPRVAPASRAESEWNAELAGGYSTRYAQAGVSWDSDHPKLIAGGPEPMSYHCPENVDWSIAALDECWRRRVARSTVVLFGRRVQRSKGGHVFSSNAPPKQNFRRTASH